MNVEPYRVCQDCGSVLESTTMYQRHAFCGECQPGATPDSGESA